MIKINTACVFLLLSLYLPSIKLKCLCVPCIQRIFVDNGSEHEQFLPPTTFTFGNIVKKQRKLLFVYMLNSSMSALDIKDVNNICNLQS